MDIWELRTLGSVQMDIWELCKWNSENQVSDTVCDSLDVRRMALFKTSFYLNPAEGMGPVCTGPKRVLLIPGGPEASRFATLVATQLIVANPSKVYGF